MSLAFALILINKLKLCKLEVDLLISLFLVEIASGDENSFLGRGWVI